MKNRDYCGEYVKGITKLQYKKRKNKDDYVLLALILIFTIEFFTHTPTKKFIEVAPFLPKFLEDKPENVFKDIEKGIKGKGKFADDFKAFKSNNNSLFDYITDTTESLYKTPNVGDKDSKRIRKLKKETDLVEQQNNISLFVNQTRFQKKTKMWNTQRDERVRKTQFHNGIDRQEQDINDWFIVGEQKALYPAHSTLHDYDRYNCRCYLTYK